MYFFVFLIDIYHFNYEIDKGIVQNINDSNSEKQKC